MKSPWNQWKYRSRVRQRLKDLCTPAGPVQQNRPYQRSALRPGRRSEPAELRNIESADLGHGVVAAR
jgi:hypothetical protein